MLKTKFVITEIKDVPVTWVFEHYLKLSERLIGQNLMVLSPFNTKDNRPSLSLFVSNKDNVTYRYNDFSSKESGDNLQLIQSLFKLNNRSEAAHMIINDYSKWLEVNKGGYKAEQFKYQEKYKVTSFVKRTWTKPDANFWMQYHIGSKILEKFKVAPLQSYTMSKEQDGVKHEIHIENPYLYGYFREDGSLYKIYAPMSDVKFIKVKDYIQGTDQLQFKHPYLIICSSLKDMCAFEKLGYEAEVIAPDSENVLIDPHVISSYKLKYKSICILFDNDTAGIAAMADYKSKYNLSGVHLPLSKDLSDSMRDHGILKIKQVLTPLLKQALV